MPTVRIPDDIFDRTVIFDLTPGQTVALCAIPTFGSLPAEVFDFIPFWSAFVFGAVAALSIILISIRTPTGQNPIEWFPAMVSNKLNGTTYYLERHQVRETPVYLSNQYSGVNDAAKQTPASETELSSNQSEPPASNSDRLAQFNPQTETRQSTTSRTEEQTNERSSQMSAGQ